LDKGYNQRKDNGTRMTEEEFKSLWQQEKSMHEVWGELVVDEISKSLSDNEIDLSSFIKIPPKYRLKDDSSLIDKAFYREKNYENPYEDIEDKVGVRFVVLLLSDIKIIQGVIESNNLWDFVPSKHFMEDQESSPLLFTYQSVHYVLRPKKEILIGDVTLQPRVACEVQVRTLLQHAHAELTHDAIYKSKKKIKASVQRTVAKSMALIETTDEFFTSVTSELNKGPLKEFGIVDKLDSIYLQGTGLTPINQKSSLIIWDDFEDVVDDKLVESIRVFVCDSENEYIWSLIKDGYLTNALYKQSISLFILWMLKKKKRKLLSNWPFSKEMLTPLATDMGINISIS
jgi:ppGpp synthetase/RelA/SpoT-type nucleotidyltranferase